MTQPLPSRLTITLEHVDGEILGGRWRASCREIDFGVTRKSLTHACAIVAETIRDWGDDAHAELRAMLKKEGEGDGA